MLHVGMGWATVTNSGGATAAVVSVKRGVTQTAGFSGRVFSTITTTGTTVHQDGWNVRVPYVYLPTPEMRPEFSQTDTVFQFRLLTAATNAVQLVITAYVEEL